MVIVNMNFIKTHLLLMKWGRIIFNTWSVDNSKIYLDTVKGRYGIKYPYFEYKISTNNDTLFLKRPTDSVFRFPIFRIKNAYDYYLKRLRLTVDLPYKNNLISNKVNATGLDIFVGFRNGKLIAKNNDDKNFHLGEIKLETAYFFASQEIELDSTNFQFKLLIDKKVNNAKIDSIKDILKSTGYKRMFRVYTNEKVDYEKTGWIDELKWFGVYE